MYTERIETDVDDPSDQSDQSDLCAALKRRDKSASKLAHSQTNSQKEDKLRPQIGIGVHRLPKGLEVVELALLVSHDVEDDVAVILKDPAGAVAFRA